jgi:GNAT superfamily N-acetyltransferase
VTARERTGPLIATARALSDGARLGWIADVMVAPAWRGRGVGRALVRLLLDHPALRTTRSIGLRTRDAQRVYAPLGFVECAPSPNPEMRLERALASDATGTSGSLAGVDQRS